MSRTESEFRGNTSHDLQDPIDMKTMVLLNKLYTKFIVDMVALEVCLQVLITIKPSNYLLVQSRQKHKKECEICSELTIKTPKRRSDVVLMFLLLTLNIFHTFFPSVSIVEFEKINVYLERTGFFLIWDRQELTLKLWNAWAT